MQYRTLYENELDKWFHFLIEDVFVGAPLSYFKREWDNDPYRDINSIFVAVDSNGAIVSGVRVFIREIYLNGKAIKTGGIGSVGTREDQRKQGLSSALFELCIGFMEKNDICVSYLLCGEQNEKHYNRYNYKSCRYLKKISKIEKNIPYRRTYNIRDVDFNKDIKTLSDMYQNFSSKYNGSPVRSTDYWKQWVASFGYNKYLIAEDNEGNPIAYLNVDLDGTRLFVFDFAFLPEYDDIFDSFISRVRGSISEELIDAQYQIPILSGLHVDEYVENCLVMYKLIKPFHNQNNLMGNTDELVETLQGTDSQSRLLLWEVDDI